jgi:hypothetical protein
VVSNDQALQFDEFNRYFELQLPGTGSASQSGPELEPEVALGMAAAHPEPESELPFQSQPQPEPEGAQQSLAAHVAQLEAEELRMQNELQRVQRELAVARSQVRGVL